MRALVTLLQSIINKVYARLYGPPKGGLTEVEYEAITLIAQEGRAALSKAREQAAFCRRRGSEQGRLFWMQVANEISLRTKGKPVTDASSARERKGA